jgi:nucleotidyltransferase/DNA polymerase involved in DNA repair
MVINSEQVSVDEAYLDVSKLKEIMSEQRVGQRNPASIREKVGLTYQVGIGQTNVIAANSIKPDGLTIVVLMLLLI